MPRRTIAFGDIHGCSAAFAALVKEIEINGQDTVIVLGDCIDRGLDSRGVIEQLLRLREKCELIVLLGNHEEMMLSAIDRPFTWNDWLACGGDTTVDSYHGIGPEQFPPEHVEYIRTWGDFHETESHFFVHGNYVEDIPLAGQHWGYLRWENLRSRMPKAHLNGKQAIVGHTSQKSGEILDAKYLKCIDTYCHGGGWLTALEVTTGQAWQVNKRGALRQPREEPS